MRIFLVIEWIHLHRPDWINDGVNTSKVRFSIEIIVDMNCLPLWKHYGWLRDVIRIIYLEAIDSSCYSIDLVPFRFLLMRKTLIETFFLACLLWDFLWKSDEFFILFFLLFFNRFLISYAGFSLFCFLTLFFSTFFARLIFEDGMFMIFIIIRVIFLILRLEIFFFHLQTNTWFNIHLILSIHTTVIMKLLGVFALQLWGN